MQECLDLPQSTVSQHLQKLRSAGVVATERIHYVVLFGLKIKLYGGRTKYVGKGVIMKLNHLNLTVTDVPAAREFLETYFGMKCEGTRGNAFAVMFDDEGFILTLMKGKNVLYPVTFHASMGGTSTAVAAPNIPEFCSPPEIMFNLMLNLSLIIFPNQPGCWYGYICMVW